jgi:hypothetical protein
MPAMSHSTGDKYDQTKISKLEVVNYYAKPCNGREAPKVHFNIVQIDISCHCKRLVYMTTSTVFACFKDVVEYANKILFISFLLQKQKNMEKLNGNSRPLPQNIGIAISPHTSPAPAQHFDPHSIANI